MKKTSMLCLALALLAGAAQAATIVQDFDTGIISPGNPTVSAFNVNLFDSSLGTLTKVTISMTLNSWGGSYTIENITAPSSLIEGNFHQGVTASLSGMRVPEGYATLFAGQTKYASLAETGMTDSLFGPTFAEREVRTTSADALEAYFALYQGSGTYVLNMNTYQNNSFDGAGAVRGTYESAQARGFLTVTYEFTPVPEPTGLALLVFGCAALGLRRRQVKV